MRLRTSPATSWPCSADLRLSQLLNPYYISASPPFENMDLFDPSDARHVHFIGVAGAGMSALALVARNRGVSVSGCDLNPSAAADLAAIGIDVLEGHDESHLQGARAVIVSAAVPETNPELRYARQNGIRVVPRKSALAELVAPGRVIGIAGTHGKTTTTVMTCQMLTAAGLAPTGIAGGRVAQWGGNAMVGRGDLFVVEADEFDGAFLELDPWLAVVTNVEPEHLECYGSVEAMEAAFTSFLMRAEVVVTPAEDDAVQRVSSGVVNHIVSFGISAGDVRVSDVIQAPDHTLFAVSLPDGNTAEVRLGVPGLHNVRNAAAAIAVVWRMGVPLGPAIEGLERFTGVGRRFERLGQAKDIEFVDDYAHHPTEVRAVLRAARQAFPDRRVVVVFQPHLYSRTEREGEAMGQALAEGADLVVVTDVYAAREEPIPGVTGEVVADAARAGGVEVLYQPDREALQRRVSQILKPGDALLTLGAGDVTLVGRALVEWLRAA